MLKEIYKVLRDIKIDSSNIVELGWVSEVFFESNLYLPKTTF